VNASKQSLAPPSPGIFTSVTTVFYITHYN
jgi:hypothetical protein